MANLFAKVKLALRITTSDFDQEIMDLILAGLADLNLAGIVKADTSDPLIARAIITYCKLNFGSTGDYEKLKESYDEQKAQLWMATNYTDWGDDDEPQDDTLEEEVQNG